MSAAAAAGTVADPRSLHAQAALRGKWRDEVRHRPIPERLAWLKSTEAIVALGAKRCREIAKEIEGRRARVAAGACAPAWTDIFDEAEELPPGMAWGTRAQLVSVDDGRRYSVRLQLSREAVRIGDGQATRRWTPPQAVELEDRIDAMHPDLAFWLTLYWPASPSALVINQIGERGARPQNGNW